MNAARPRFWVEVPSAFRHDWVFHFVVFSVGLLLGVLASAVWMVLP